MLLDADIYSFLLKETTKSLITVAAGALVGYLGLKIYFRQREYEIVKQRYLEGGIDKFINEIELCNSTVMQNWGVCMMAITMAAINKKASQESLKEFKPLPDFSTYSACHARVRKITGSDSFSRVHQKITAFYSVQNKMMLETAEKCIEEITSASSESTEDLKYLLSKRLDFFDSIKNKLMKYSAFLRVTQDISEFIETNKLGFKSIQKSSKNKRMRKIVNEFEEIFKEELKK